MAHRSFLRKGRRKRAETDRSRPCAPLSLFLTGGDLAREGGTSETENKEGGRGLGRWWRGFSNRLKAFDENNSHGSLSNKCMEGEEKWEGEAGEKKCIVVPHPSMKEDCVVPRRSRFADHNNKTPDKPNEHNNDCVKPRRSILCARFHLHSPGEKKVVVRKAVSFCKEVSVVLIPHKTEISAEAKASLWWNGQENKQFIRRVVALLPVGTDLTKSLLVLGKACRDLVEVEEDPIQSDTDVDPMLGLTELFNEKQNTTTTSCTTWEGEEKKNELLQDTPQQQQCSLPEVCRASISRNEVSTLNNWGGMLSNCDYSAISSDIPLSGLVDNHPHWQTASDFNLEQKTGLSKFGQCHQPTPAVIA